MAPHRDAEMDALVAMLTEAGLVESFADEDGEPALRLTEKKALGLDLRIAWCLRINSMTAGLCLPCRMLAPITIMS